MTISRRTFIRSAVVGGATVGASAAVTACRDGDSSSSAFVSFQRRMSQFLNTQARLAGEPLEEYLEPQGGGFYFALPGVAPGDWLARSLLT